MIQKEDRRILASSGLVAADRAGVASVELSMQHEKEIRAIVADITASASFAETLQKTEKKQGRNEALRAVLPARVKKAEEDALRFADYIAAGAAVNPVLFRVQYNKLMRLAGEILGGEHQQIDDTLFQNNKVQIPVVDMGNVQGGEKKKTEPDLEVQKPQKEPKPQGEKPGKKTEEQTQEAGEESRMLKAIERMASDLGRRARNVRQQASRAHTEAEAIVAGPFRGDADFVALIRKTTLEAAEAASELERLSVRANGLVNEARTAGRRRREVILNEIEALPVLDIERNADVVLEHFYALPRGQREHALGEMLDIRDILHQSSSERSAEAERLLKDARAAARSRNDADLMRLLGEMQALVRAPEPVVDAALATVPDASVAKSAKPDRYRPEVRKDIKVLSREQRKLLGGFSAAVDSLGTSPPPDDISAFDAEYPESRLIEIASILAVPPKNRNGDDLDFLREAREAFIAVVRMSPEVALSHLSESVSQPAPAPEPYVVPEPIAELDPVPESAVVLATSRDADASSANVAADVSSKDPGTALMVSGPTALTPYRRPDRIRRTRLPAASDRSNDASSSSDASAPEVSTAESVAPITDALSRETEDVIVSPAPVAATPMSEPEMSVRRMAAEPVISRDLPRKKLHRPPHDSRLLLIPTPTREDFVEEDLVRAVPPVAEAQWEEDEGEATSSIDLLERRTQINAILEHVAVRSVWRENIHDLSEVETPLSSLHSDAERRNYIRRQLLLNGGTEGLSVRNLIAQVRHHDAVRAMFDLMLLQLEGLSVEQRRAVLAQELVPAPEMRRTASETTRSVPEAPRVPSPRRARERHEPGPGSLSPAEEGRAPRARGGISERETKNESIWSRASSWLKKETGDVYRVHVKGELTQAERQENAPTLSRQAMLAGGVLSGALSFYGVAFPIDALRYMSQRYFVGSERQEIAEAVSEAIARRRGGEKGVSAVDRLPERDAAIQIRIEKSRYLTDAQKKTMLDELHGAVNTFSTETSLRNEHLSREVGRILDHTIRTRISAEKVGKEALNSLFTITGAHLLRAPAYGMVSIFERWNALTRESPESPAADRLQSLVAVGFTEWWDKARGKSGRLAQAAAIGTAARFVGMSFVGGKAVGDLAVGAFEFAERNNIIGALLDGWQKIEAAYSASDAPKFLRNMFTDAGHHAVEKVEILDADPGNDESEPFTPEDTISDIVMAPERIPVEAVVGDKGSITGTFLAAVDAHPDLLQGLERTALEDDYAAKLLVRRLAAKDGLLDYWLSEKAVGNLAIVPRYDTDGLHAAFLNPKTGSAYSIAELKDMGWLVKVGNA